MNTQKTHTQNQQALREAIRRIALGGVINSQGQIKGNERATGYVVKIHDDENDELFGTIDVQEYDTEESPSANENIKYGFHEGVYLSALQDGHKGMVIVPKLYSDVTIAKNPVDHTEYVVMFSHVDIIQLDSHDKVSIGVKEREEFDIDDDNSPDIEDLEETGVYTNQTFTKDSIVTTVATSEQDKDRSSIVMDFQHIETKVGEKTSSIMDQEKVQAKFDKSEVTIDGDKIIIKKDNEQVKVTGDQVFLGSESGTEDAVLGVTLAKTMMKILDALTNAKTTTQLGPQPLINMAQFASLKAQINSYISSHSGFLTRKVQVQK